MSNVQINLQQAAERLLQADDILILSHRRPDGDTIGTAFGLHYALKELGKRSRVECADDFPKKFSYFYANYEPENFEPQFVVAVDVASVSLLGKLAHVYGESVDLVIDHHKSNEFYGKETLLDVAAPATTEIMYLMLEYLGVSLNKDIANALFTGLITDTGGFRFPTVTARTFRVAADLLDGGAEHGKINRVIFESTSRGRLAVEALAINTLKYYLDNRCAVLYLPGDVKEMYCIDEEELDGISSLPRTIDGIDVGVTIRDLGKNTYRISLRTESPYDASEICAQFGGGGHLNAAGCTMEGELADVEAKLVQAVERELGSVKE